MENQLEKTTGNNNVPATFNFFDPQQFDVMQRICRSLASSDIVPEMYKFTPTPFPANANEQQIELTKLANKRAESKAMANCMIAVDMAQRMGANVLMVMQNMIIIYGRPSWSSKFLIATVNGCGRFNAMKYRMTNVGKLGKVNYVEYEWNGQKKAPVNKVFDGTLIDNIECVAYTTQRGSNEVLESSPISIEMAIKEGWYTKAGSKWQTMQNQMLMYRAASFWTSTYAPELSMGMKTEYEQMDIIEVDYEDVTPVKEKVADLVDEQAKEDETLGFGEEKKELAEAQKPTEIPVAEKPKETAVQPNEGEKPEQTGLKF